MGVKMKPTQMYKDDVKRRLIGQIEDKILSVANIYNEVTTSDLQGIAHVEARKILEIVKGYLKED